MTTRRLGLAMALMLSLPGLAAAAWEMAGNKRIELHAQDGTAVPIGEVRFEPIDGESARFVLHMDHARFKDFFLSMKEFKCLESEREIQCHVPYPYPQPGIVSTRDLRWLEHSLLFLFKAPKDFGAKLWNGLYYRLEADGEGLVGTPYAVDLNAIGAPPDDAAVPPYHASDLSEIAPDARWYPRLTIR
ncbi:MAG: hypothetical protein KDG55_11705 [Rhodocyclaceae bacterium]|nr:hypothetical protein [Rhodocyclaceae bacterium]